MLFVSSLSAFQVHAAIGEVKLIPPQPEIPPTFLEQYWLWLIVLGFPALLMIAALALVFRIRAGAQNPDGESPVEHARRELKSILESPPNSEAIMRATKHLRVYLTLAFGLPADELTTRELSSHLRTNSRLGADLASELARFFERCDQLKFAPGANPDVEPLRRALELLEVCERRRAALDQARASQPPVYS